MKKILFISFSCCILFSLIAKAQRIETLLGEELEVYER